MHTTLTANTRFLDGAATLIRSGEGETYADEEYTGARTLRAVRSRLTRERRSGDRHAQALVHMHNTPHGEGAYLAIDGDGEYVAGPTSERRGAGFGAAA